MTVNSKLDRELAEVIVLKIMVNDTRGTEQLPQTAMGKDNENSCWLSHWDTRDADQYI